MLSSSVLSDSDSIQRNTVIAGAKPGSQVSQWDESKAAVSDALVDASLILSRGKLVSLNFHRARARRVQDADMRRIDLRFRARVEDS